MALKTFFGRAIQKLAISSGVQSKLAKLSAADRTKASASFSRFGASTDPVEGKRLYDEAVAKQKSATIKGAAIIAAGVGAAASLGAFSGAASGAASGGASAGATSASEAALGSGLKIGGGKVGLSASSTLGFTATPSGVAAFESGINLSQLGAAGAAGAAGVKTTAAATKATSTASNVGVKTASGTITKGGLGISEAASGLSAASTLFAPRMAAMPEAEALPDRDKLPQPARLPKQFETRAGDLGRRALAAGAQRSDNQADYLGSRPGVKKRGEARRALYGI